MVRTGNGSCLCRCISLLDSHQTQKAGLTGNDTHSLSANTRPSYNVTQQTASATNSNQDAILIAFISFGVFAMVSSCVFLLVVRRYKRRFHAASRSTRQHSVFSIETDDSQPVWDDRFDVNAIARSPSPSPPPERLQRAPSAGLGVVRGHNLFRIVSDATDDDSHTDDYSNTGSWDASGFAGAKLAAADTAAGNHANGLFATILQQEEDSASVAIRNINDINCQYRLFQKPRTASEIIGDNAEPETAASVAESEYSMNAFTKAKNKRGDFRMFEFAMGIQKEKLATQECMDHVPELAC